MSLTTLPTELIMAAFQYMPSKGDIAHLAQTCHKFHDLLMPELYHLSFQENEGDTLYWAAEHGHCRIVQSFLMANGHLGPNLLLPHMNRALSLSAQHGQISVVNTLLSMEGVDPDNKSSKLERTPLSYAAQGGYIDIVRCLLETNRVDPNSKDRIYAHSPLIWAMRYPSGESDLKPEMAPGAIRSAQDRSIPVIQLLLENGANIEFMGYDCRNALYWATAGGFGSSAIVRLLLQKGARPDGHVDEKQRVMVNSRQRSRIQRWDEHPFLIKGIYLPLSFAAWAGYDEVVRALLEFNANIDCTNISGLIRNHHPLACAAEKGHLSTVRLLIERGACYQSPGCPLLCATRNGHAEMVQLLVDEMMHHDSRITGGGQRGEEKVGIKLCTRKGRKHSPGNQAMLALLEAVKLGNVEVVKLLLAVPGVDINHELLQGSHTPLMIAVRSRPPIIEMIKVLLAVEGIEIRINEPQDLEGNTVFIWAHHNECDEEIIQLLVDNGAQRTNEPLRVASLAAPQNWQTEAPLMTPGDRID
ncbi:hypothetical protein PENANT_c074G11712 [Penicillium antarcticum]|uniref:F-box domain-containing protein n=1 Tax=Penicillium antarcticum TaxID=416450 RepID=A0A1V6PPE4_9EURO|nr:hypothetical protein PENANT_c074G11712 [Penicillium antarcticum]